MHVISFAQEETTWLDVVGCWVFGEGLTFGGKFWSKTRKIALALSQRGRQLRLGKFILCEQRYSLDLPDCAFSHRLRLLLPSVSVVFGSLFGSTTSWFYIAEHLGFGRQQGSHLGG